jgi:hypothetical protein
MRLKIKVWIMSLRTWLILKISGCDTILIGLRFTETLHIGKAQKVFIANCLFIDK